MSAARKSASTVPRTVDDLWGSDLVPGRYAGHDGLVYDLRPRRILDLLIGVERWSSRDFLVQGGRRVTYRAFLGALEPAAGLLTSRGVGQGDRVMILAYNAPELVLAAWATWQAGAVPVMANRWWSEHEIEYALEVAAPKLLITDVPCPDRHATATMALDELSPMFNEDAVRRSSVPAPEADEDDPGLVLFTSGSSGRPKAVVLSHRSVVANQHNLLHRSRRLPPDLPLDRPQQVALVATPMFHVGGVSNMVTQMIVGGRLVMTEGKFDPAQVINLLETEGVQSWGGVPTMATRVIEHPDFAGADLSRLRTFPLGGAPISDALFDRLRSKLPQLKDRGLSNMWGMTESGGFVTLAGAADLAERPGTVGKPYPASEIRIDGPDEHGHGEIQVRAATVMLEYLNSDEQAVDEEGWLSTGDRGYIDGDGYLYIVGRSKDVVIRGGENIACANVELGLLAHPSVVEVAVFGVPHADLGEELAAVVRIRNDDAVTVDDLRDFLKKRLAYFEVPSEWALVESALPTLAGEKIDKKAVRADFMARPT